eukprot:PLAT15318.1.p1 GENE.PLAT15318.1~~PLAT15318.1.p1  ORF type:complete len:519 (+),score=266.36 PLAT15318.1:63-1559(+)
MAEEASVKHYDVAVIGSGGGTKLSTPASRLGMKAAIIESGFDTIEDGEPVHKIGLGGTCLNRGCIPSKMLIHAADVAEEIREAGRYEITTHGYDVDWRKLVTDTSATVDGTSSSIDRAYSKNDNLDYYAEEASFVGPKRIKVGDQEITADKVFIAAGSRPRVPDIPGLADTPYMTSTEALRLLKKPEKLIVIGGGYIATELAHFYGGLDVDVHIFARSTLLRFEDSEVADEFSRIFTSKYKTYLHAKSLSVSYDADSKLFTYRYSTEEDGEQEITADQLLLATGVVPNSDRLNLAAAGVDVDDRGFVKVDDRLRTSAEGVWALGDIAGNWLFRHSVNFEGNYLFENLIHPDSRVDEGSDYPAIDYVGMPHAVFSNPQVAGVGEREQDLIARGADYVKGVNPYAKSAMGDALRSDSGFAKLLIERGTRKVLGFHVVGHEASILAHVVIPLMRKDATLDDLLYCIYIHPALPEIVRNSARRARDALMEAGDDLPVKLRIA